MLENCSLVNRVTSVSPEPTELMTFVPVWTRLAVRDTEGYTGSRFKTFQMPQAPPPLPRE